MDAQNLPVLITDELIRTALREDGQGDEELPFSDVPKLTLSYHRIVSIGGLDGLQSLTTLRLDNNNITEITGLDGLPNLEWLDLSFNHIKKLENLGGLTKLRDFAITHNELTSLDGVEALAGSLQSLLLSHNVIPIESAIGQLRKLRKLRSLSVAGNVSIPEQSFLIAHLPGILFLDYRRVSAKEHKEAEDAYRDALLQLKDTEPVTDDEAQDGDPEERRLLAALVGLAPSLRDEPNTAQLCELAPVAELMAAYTADWGAVADAFRPHVHFAAATRLIAEVEIAVSQIGDETDVLIHRALDPVQQRASLALARAAEHVGERAGQNAECVEALRALDNDVAAAFRQSVLAESERAMRVDQALRNFARTLGTAVDQNVEQICALFGSWRDADKTLSTAASEASMQLLEQMQSAMLSGGDTLAASPLLVDRASPTEKLDAASDARQQLIDRVEDAFCKHRRALLDVALARLQREESERHTLRVYQLRQWRQGLAAEAERVQSLL